MLIPCRAGKTRAEQQPGGVLGFVVAGSVELHARPAPTRARLGMDDDAPRPRRRAALRPAARHPVRAVYPSWSVPGRVHEGHRHQARQPAAGVATRPLGSVVAVAHTDRLEFPVGHARMVLFRGVKSRPRGTKSEDSRALLQALLASSVSRREMVVPEISATIPRVPLHGEVGWVKRTGACRAGAGSRASA